MNAHKIKEFLYENGYPLYRFKQVEKGIYLDFRKNFPDIKELPEELRKQLAENFSVLSFSTGEILESPSGEAVKALLVLKDGKKIESVILNKSCGEWAVCVSTQVGCPVRCKFCYSGRYGLKRNLSSEEISDQVLFWGQFLKEKESGKLSSVVYMGMGEPFLNYENVVESVKILNSCMGMGKRHISVSTVGHVPNIRRFARDLPQVNLAISLHSASDEKRNELVPFNLKYPLSQLSRAVKDYLDSAKRKIFIEYVMLAGINDKEKDARKLVKWIKDTHLKRYFTVNLIPYNQTGGEFRIPEKENMRAFQNLLILNGIEATIRKSLGSDIRGACGQLANKR